MCVYFIYISDKYLLWSRSILISMNYLSSRRMAVLLQFFQNVLRLQTNSGNAGIPIWIATPIPCLPLVSWKERMTLMKTMAFIQYQKVYQTRVYHNMHRWQPVRGVIWWMDRDIHPWTCTTRKYDPIACHSLCNQAEGYLNRHSKCSCNY